MRSLLFFLCLLAGIEAFSQIKLPRLISDGMVLQRGVKTKLWGWATPYEKITLQFSGKEFNAVADANGQWIIHLPKQNAGGPYDMNFIASNKIQVKNILFGDVWLCSGQSNMGLAMERLQHKYPDIIASANNYQIRQFLVPARYNFANPDPDVESGEWLSVNRR